MGHFMFIDNLFNFFKKINYSRIMPVLLCPVLLLCTSISGFAATQTTYISNSSVVTWFESSVPKLRISDYDNTALFDFDTTQLNGLNEYIGSNPTLENVRYLRLYNNSHSINLQYMPDLYDYWLSFTVYSNVEPIPSNFTFMPDYVQVFARNCVDSGSYDYYYLTDLSILHSDDSSDIGFTAIGKIPDLESSNILGFRLIDNSTGLLPVNLRLQPFIYAVPKNNGATAADISAIIAAINSQTSSLNSSINNQTSVIGGKLDSTNDFISNGNSSTSGIVSQFQSNLNEFNSVISQFDNIENGFITDFTMSNEEIKSTLSDYQFTGNLLSCANWVTDTYMDFFENSGDFKQYFIYPLIMGIALFFIGRGQVILGNLYRKPYDSSTHTVTTGYTERYSDGSKRTETYSRTTGKGGKLRK